MGGNRHDIDSDAINRTPRKLSQGNASHAREAAAETTDRAKGADSLFGKSIR